MFDNKHAKNISLFFLIFFIICVANSCAYTKIESLVDTDFAPKDKSAEILLVEGDIGRKYESIAFLTVVGSLVTKKEQMDKKMKKEARKIGGDAVLFVTYSKQSGHYPMVTGVIIKYN